jgi:hypothetical protein
MRFTGGRAPRRALSIGGIVLVTGLGLAACGGGGGNDPGFNQTVKGEHGSQSSVRFGKDAKIPKDFPVNVPLPNAGKLRAVVDEANPPNASYTMTYALGGRDGIRTGNQYRTRLEKSGFKIEHFSSIGGTDGGLVQFDAIGKKWDVAVVSGKANPRDRAALSVQVHTHGQVTSGIGGIGDTTPNTPTPTGSGTPVPDEATTTTTLGF